MFLYVEVLYVLGMKHSNHEENVVFEGQHLWQSVTNAAEKLPSSVSHETKHPCGSGFLNI